MNRMLFFEGFYCDVRVGSGTCDVGGYGFCMMKRAMGRSIGCEEG